MTPDLMEKIWVVVSSGRSSKFEEGVAGVGTNLKVSNFILLPLPSTELRVYVAS